MVWLQVDGSHGSRIKAALSGRLREIIVGECSSAQSRNRVISRFFQGHHDAHLTVTCDV